MNVICSLMDGAKVCFKGEVSYHPDIIVKGSLTFHGLRHAERKQVIGRRNWRVGA